MYNLIFTAFPIGVYAVLDFQHSREEFKTKPLLYLIGLRDSCFNTKLFQLEMLNAIINALIIIVVVFNTSGDYFWISASIVYAIVIIVANLRVVQKINNHTWLSTAVLVVSTMLFYL